MFCSNCGMQLPEGTNFCTNCGAQQVVYENVAPAQNYVQQAPEKAQKKKPNILVIVAVVLGAFLLGKFVIAPSMTGDSGKETTGQTQQQTPATEHTSSAAYEAVFEDTYIVHFQSFFNMETASFAMEQEGGIICCSDYGYQDDVVKQWVETVYIPVSQLTDDQKAQTETQVKTQFAVLEALSCCTVDYKMGANYITVTCTYKDMDQPENYGALYDAGLMNVNTLISMSATESNLLSEGFVKK